MSLNPSLAIHFYPVCFFVKVMDIWDTYLSYLLYYIGYYTMCMLQESCYDARGYLGWEVVDALAENTF